MTGLKVYNFMPVFAFMYSDRTIDNIFNINDGVIEMSRMKIDRTGHTFVTRIVPLLIVIALVVNSCASTGGASTPDRRSQDYLMGADLVQAGYSNVYDAVTAFKPQWLTLRGQRSFSSPGSVQAYLDGTQIGPAELLRSLSTNMVNYIRYYDGIEAAARWGLDHEHGAIYVSTRPLSGNE